MQKVLCFIHRVHGVWMLCGISKVRTDVVEVIQERLWGRTLPFRQLQDHWPPKKGIDTFPLNDLAVVPTQGCFNSTHQVKGGSSGLLICRARTSTAEIYAGMRWEFFGRLLGKQG